jgi:hypothetical protein
MQKQAVFALLSESFNEFYLKYKTDAMNLDLCNI